MAYDHPSRLLVFCMIFCAKTAASTDQRAHFEKKVSLLLTEEPKSLKCFSETLGDLSCFWEEDEERAGSADQYTFTYTYQRENSSRCPVKTFPAVGAKRLFMCQLNKTNMFVPMDVQVHKDGVQIHNRSIFIELIILLDPPADVRVSTTDQQGQLRVRWVPPTLKYMESLMMYEVSYATAESHVGQVEEVDGSELVLRDLEPGTQYKVRVRVKPGDGISYDGYWSAWTDPIFMDTLPADLDPLIISLICIISLFFIMLSVMILLSHRRFLIKKIWPVIPNPESKFQGLFSVYGGDFQEWLGQTNGGIWLSPAFFYSEERASPLEVLSELSMGPPLASPPLPPKATRAMASEREEEGERVDEEKTLIRVDSVLMERWKETSHDHWLMDQLRALHHHPAPCSQSSLMESQDAYVTLNGHNHSRDEHLDDILEETLPLEVLFASGTKSSESQSDLGSLQQSSGSGRLSSQSSFEYPNHTWSPKGPGYTYMAVADSGVSMDYSPMSSSRIGDIGKLSVFAHEYKNEIPVPRKPLLTSQHPLRYGC